MPAPRGGDPVSLVFHALEELDFVKRSVEMLLKRLDALEHRVTSLEPTRA